jgi:hypothetical protein
MERAAPDARLGVLPAIPWTVVCNAPDCMTAFADQFECLIITLIKLLTEAGRRPELRGSPKCSRHRAAVVHFLRRTL